MTEAMADQIEIAEKAAAHWNSVTATGRIPRTRWWLEPAIVRHVNRRICGQRLDGVGAGLCQWAIDTLDDLPWARAVSVGGGNGVKEMALLERGIVEHVDVFEIASNRVAQGRQIAEERGLSQRITFHERLLQPHELAGRYDVVHWNNSLHHMLDVDEWLGWSHRALRPGGALLMDDFVGPTRFQWTKRQCRIASRYRRSLPDRLLTNPADPATTLEKRIKRPSIAEMLASDPTEAADSERIIDSLHRYFPGAEIRFTGGVIYSLALQDMLANVDPDADAGLIERALIIDDLLSQLGENHYAAAIAQRPSEPATAPPHSMRIVSEAKRGAQRIRRVVRDPRRARAALGRRLLAGDEPTLS